MSSPMSNPRNCPSTKAIRNTDEVVDEIVMRYESGVSITQLAERFGKGRETIRNILKRRGVTLHGAGVVDWTPELDAELVRLWKLGSMSAADIAAEIGISRLFKNGGKNAVIGRINRLRINGEESLSKKQRGDKWGRGANIREYKRRARAIREADMYARRASLKGKDFKASALAFLEWRQSISSAP